MNRFKNSLKDARHFVKTYLNLFKYGRGGYAAAVDLNHRQRKGLVMDVSGPPRNACPGTLIILSIVSLS